MLFSGRGKVAKAFAGKHVLVVKDKIVPMKDNYEQFWQDMKQLEKNMARRQQQPLSPGMILLIF